MPAGSIQMLVNTADLRSALVLILGRGRGVSVPRVCVMEGGDKASADMGRGDVGGECREGPKAHMHHGSSQMPGAAPAGPVTSPSKHPSGPTSLQCCRSLLPCSAVPCYALLSSDRGEQRVTGHGTRQCVPCCALLPAAMAQQIEEPRSSPPKEAVHCNPPSLPRTTDPSQHLVFMVGDERTYMSAPYVRL